MVWGGGDFKNYLVPKLCPSWGGTSFTRPGFSEPIFLLGDTDTIFLLYDIRRKFTAIATERFKKCLSLVVI